MANITPKIDIGNYKNQTDFYVEAKPIQGQGIFQSSKLDVSLKRKEPAKPQHGLLIGAVIVAGILYLSMKVDERD